MKNLAEKVKEQPTMDIIIPPRELSIDELRLILAFHSALLLSFKLSIDGAWKVIAQVLLTAFSISEENVDEYREKILEREENNVTTQ